MDALQIAAKFGPVLKEHLPDRTPIERMKLADALAALLPSASVGGEREALEQIAINSNCDWDQVRKHPAKQIDLIHTLAVDALYAAPVAIEGREQPLCQDVPDRIYLLDCGSGDISWCDDPDPDGANDDAVAVEYVRVGIWHKPVEKDDSQ